VCLLFVVDWLQVLGGALLGSLFWHMDRGGRRAAYAFFAFSAWAMTDSLCRVIMPLDIGPVSDVVFAGLTIALCVTVALWLTERARQQPEAALPGRNELAFAREQPVLQRKP
jgi:hypothetical protein